MSEAKPQKLSPQLRPLLLSRFLTRIGDTAWDFAVPITLAQMFPESMNYATGYFLILKIAQVFLLPRMGAAIDKWPRTRAIKVGVSTQILATVLGSVFMFVLGQMNHASPFLLLSYFVVTLCGSAGALGANLIEIAVTHDLIPAAVTRPELPTINSRLKQIELFSEVAVPFVMGLLLVFGSQFHPLAGLMLIAFINAVSFLFEYKMLHRFFLNRPDLKSKTNNIPLPSLTFFQQFREGWSLFSKHRIRFVAMTYAILWVNVLSPHGVLLTTYLMQGMHVSEFEVGVFRGAGAAVGMLTTILFPFFVARSGLIRAGFVSVCFQALSLSVATFAFWQHDVSLFVISILFSRLGLYGFTLAQSQMRQEFIESEVRGRINGTTNAFCNLASMFLYGFAMLFPRPDQFFAMVLTSLICVISAAILSVVTRKTLQKV